MSEKIKNAFETLNAVNVNEHTEVKDTGKTKLTYLSWAWAWAEVKKRYPDASYEIEKFNGLPYVFDEKTGYMVYTTVTIEGITHEMWLPVMDSNNRAMLDHPYDVSTAYKTFTVNKATMFDINKTIMRCLTKNLAMFGLGLYIYAGEDLPEDADDEQPKTPSKAAQPKAKAQPAKNTDQRPSQRKAQPTTPEKPVEVISFRDEFRKFIKENGLDNETVTRILTDCNLKADSPDEEWEKGLMYGIAYIGGMVQ